jgi:site-specific recombinase XerD
MAKVRRYRGKLVIDYYDSDGKRHRPQVASREEGHRLLAEIEANDRKEPTKGTFKEYGDWWLENVAKEQIESSTYEEYKRALTLHLYPAFGNKRFAKVTRRMVRELITSKRKGSPAQNEGDKPIKPLSQSSIRNILAPIRGMYNQAIEDDEAFRNPAERMGRSNAKKDTKRLVDPLTREEVQVTRH